MPLKSRFPFLAALLAVSLAGCGTNKACFSELDYQKAVDRPRLQMPAGVPGSERLAPTVIPPVGSNVGKLDPAPHCLDEPPSYFGRKAPVAESVEDAVNAWAAAWADRRPDAVTQSYSSAFQAEGEGGVTAFLEQRRDQVQNGISPAARLEDVTVTSPTADRRVVNFVQRFGDQRVRKELTLAREAKGWRIVAERTIAGP